MTRLWFKAPLAVVLAALAGAASSDVAILQIRVLEGEGAVHRSGHRATRPLAVEITDETGRPVEGATVSFRMPEDGPSGVFSNGLNTAVMATDAQGRAATAGMRWNQTTGPLNIRITAVKGQARAGAAVFLYLSDANPPSRARSRVKWIAVAAGAVVAARVARSATAAEKPGSPAEVYRPPQVGAPTISIRRP